MTETKQVKLYKIHGIELISFSIQPKTVKVYPGDMFEFTIRQEQKTNAEKRLIIVFTYVVVKETGTETVLANLEVACGFEIPLFESVIKRGTEGDYIIPHELNISINRMSIAISRGILYSHLRGSYLQDVTLPMLPIE